MDVYLSSLIPRNYNHACSGLLADPLDNFEVIELFS
jgi:hypothetical protein